MPQALDTIFSLRSAASGEKSIVSSQSVKEKMEGSIGFVDNAHSTRKSTTSSYQVKKAMEKAKEYEKRMVSRVQFLVKEERKVLQKIDATK